MYIYIYIYIRHRASGTRGVWCSNTGGLSRVLLRDSLWERYISRGNPSLHRYQNPANRKTSKTYSDITVLSQNVDKHTAGEPPPASGSPPLAEPGGSQNSLKK